MPSKNALKEYESGGYYHIYNRGVNKRLIFKDQKDYSTFISYLHFYLSPPNSLRGLSSQAQYPIAPSKVLKNYNGEIELIAYCLMPNHFHLMVRQNSDHGIDHFMRSLTTKYVRYFNTHYQRVGHLFQARYKAVRIENEYQFTYLTKYIHRNPLDMKPYCNNAQSLSSYKYSSYGNYLGLFQQQWIKTEDILCYFSKGIGSCSYKSFVETSVNDDITIIEKVTLDFE